MVFTDEQVAVLRKVFASREFQNLIGAEEWDLTEPEEMILWDMINSSTVP